LRDTGTLRRNMRGMPTKNGKNDSPVSLATIRTASASSLALAAGSSRSKLQSQIGSSTNVHRYPKGIVNPESLKNRLSKPGLWWFRPI
jgi:hypothetical protein